MVEIEVDKVVVTRLVGDHGVIHPTGERGRGSQLGGSLLHDLPQELDAGGTLTTQLAAFRPPQDVVGLKGRFPRLFGDVGFSMARVSATGDGCPELVGHLLASQVAPYPRRVALVAALVEHHGLAILLPQVPALVDVGVLYADMRDVGIALVEHPHGIVDAPQVRVRVFLGETLQEVRPVGVGFLLHEIELVGHAPPHVLVGGKASHQVVNVKVVGLVTHVGEAPTVVGMEDDEIGLNAQAVQRRDLSLQVAEVIGVEAGEVPVGQGFSLVGIAQGLILVPVVTLREHAHPHLVEIALRQRLQGLLDEAVGLVNPGIAGSAEGVVGRAVGIGHIEGVYHADGTMVSRACGDAGETAPLVIQLAQVALGHIFPFSLQGGHEAYLVDAVAVVEAIHVDGVMGMDELGGKPCVGEGVARGLCFQRQLEHTPPLYVFGLGAHDGEGGQQGEGHDSLEPFVPWGKVFSHSVKV